MMEPEAGAFWTWALAAYERPGVQESCLLLQDQWGQNIPLLLWAAWAQATGRRLDAEALEAGSDAARAWEETVIGPLRRVRQTLTAPIADMDDHRRLSTREAVKAVELQAERRLMETLAELAGPQPQAPETAAARTPSAVEALAAASKVWTKVTPRPLLNDLAVALSA